MFAVPIGLKPYHLNNSQARASVVTMVTKVSEEYQEAGTENNLVIFYCYCIVFSFKSSSFI